MRDLRGPLHGVSGGHSKTGSRDVDEPEGSMDDGMPYGEITETDVENLFHFARRLKGLDLNFRNLNARNPVFRLVTTMFTAT